MTSGFINKTKEIIKIEPNGFIERGNFAVVCKCDFCGLIGNHFHTLQQTGRHSCYAKECKSKLDELEDKYLKEGSIEEAKEKMINEILKVNPTLTREEAEILANAKLPIIKQEKKQKNKVNGIKRKQKKPNFKSETRERMSSIMKRYNELMKQGMNKSKALKQAHQEIDTKKWF